ncbi:MAG TPA: TMEM175 family protein [Gemmatimonadaceae bacterium]|nr:TMEM175 family protein [Gemmatimonadaceae bacterium]
MNKGRLEAFSDGVLAVVITIMVLEMHAPHEASWGAIRPLIPVILSYVLSYVFIGIYWSNHHHLLQAIRHVSGGVLWANLHLLFWLSLIPFVTSWMGETHFGSIAVAAYGTVLLAAACAYYILVRSLIAVHGSDSTLKRAIGDDRKGIVSIVLYVIAIVFALWIPAVAEAVFVLVAIMWLVPDRRIERVISTVP